MDCAPLFHEKGKMGGEMTARDELTTSSVISTMRVTLYDLPPFHQAPPPKTVTLGIKFPTWTCWEHWECIQTAAGERDKNIKQHKKKHRECLAAIRQNNNYRNSNNKATQRL